VYYADWGRHGHECKSNVLAEGPFILREFAKPIFVSPIVLLPLLGAVTGATLDALQITSFWFLSFQNGFFWKRCSPLPRTNLKCLLTFIFLTVFSGLAAPASSQAGKAEAEEAYQDFFWLDRSDDRSLSERALNAIGFSLAPALSDAVTL
jgi:hypothetical protein